MAWAGRRKDQRWIFLRHVRGRTTSWISLTAASFIERSGDSSPSNFRASCTRSSVKFTCSSVSFFTMERSAEALDRFKAIQAQGAIDEGFRGNLEELKEVTVRRGKQRGFNRFALSLRFPFHARIYCNLLSKSQLVLFQPQAQVTAYGHAQNCHVTVEILYQSG